MNESRISMHKPLIRFCRWHPDGSAVSVIRGTGELEIVTPDSTRSEPISGNRITWVHGGHRFAIVNEREIFIRSVNRLRIVDNRSFPDVISSSCWSPDDRLLAIAFDTGGIEILDVETLATVLSAVEHGESVILDWHSEHSLVSASISALCIWPRIVTADLIDKAR